MKRVYCYVIIVLLTFIGCVNKDELAGDDLVMGNHTLKVQIEQSANTRTMVDEENRVCWVKGDQIGVFGGDGVVNIPFSFSGMADSGQSAIFKGNLPEGGVPSVAYFPYDDEAVLEGDKLSFVLPSEYDYTENSNAPMIGVKQDDGSFIFKHLCGLLKFSIVDIPDDAKQVIITAKGENAPNISGTCIVEDVNEDGAVLSIPEGSSQVTIKMNGEVGTQTFYISVPVGVYSELQVVLEKEDGTYFFSEKLSNVTIRRATIFHVTKDLAEADKSLDEFVQTSVYMSSDEFLSGLEQLLKNNEAVSGYELNINGCEITYKDGSIQLLSFVYTGDPFGISTEPAPVEEEPTYDWIADAAELDGFTLVSSTETRASSEDDIFHNMNILRWAPYQNDLGIGWDYQTLLEKSPLKLNVIGNYVNQEATSSRLMDNLSQAGIIDIESHGSGGKYIFIPANLIDRGIYGAVDCRTIYFSKKNVLKIDSLTQNVGIPKAAFERYSYVENGILFNNSCESAYESSQSLQGVFMNGGVSTYTGYTNIVNTYNIQEKMNWYTNSLLCDLKSNIESVPDKLSYSGQGLEIKEEGGKVTYQFTHAAGYFDVTTRKEMQFVEFGPQGSVETTETEIYLPFQFKGAENLKDVCKFGILISNQKEIEEKITGSNIGNYTVGKALPISEMLGKTNSRFKVSKEDLINALNKMGIGSSGTKYYWIYLEYKGRYYISNEYGVFYLEESCEDIMREYLIRLYHDTDGDNWTRNDNWLSDKPITEWYGVYKPNDCSYTILLSSNNLRGEVNLSDCLYLSNLDCNNNALTSLDLSGCSILKNLSCYFNNLSSLDVSGCLNLEYLDCTSNALAKLAVSDYLSLKYLYCGYNALTSLGVSWCSSLEALNCDNNVLTDLDLSGCVRLGSLECHNNALMNLKISDCSNLVSLVCQNNVLTELDCFNSSVLKILSCGDNKLSKLDVSHCPVLEYLNCPNNVLAELDISGCLNLTDIYCPNNHLTNIDVSGYLFLESLFCDNNNLTNLDVSGCLALSTLSCYFNDNLMNLDASGCSALEKIDCSKMALTNLAVRGCSMLKQLFCDNNVLTHLDLSGCSALELLNCSHNLLTHLDLSDCLSLSSLGCRNNKIFSEVPSHLRGAYLDLDYRYDYYYEDGETKYIDNNIGWWYPGEPGSGKHDWPD